LAKKRKKSYWRIWNTVAAIPPGRVASYGQVAELSGFANGARMVAPAMRNAPANVDLPWHRVVNVHGKISIPASDPAHGEQVRRLTAESVPVIGDRVEMSRYGWTPDLDELIWGPPSFEAAENDGGLR
jgi:methylated-DNA-protein-cysteine methyltransferase-like protein